MGASFEGNRRESFVFFFPRDWVDEAGRGLQSSCSLICLATPVFFSVTLFPTLSPVVLFFCQELVNLFLSTRHWSTNPRASFRSGPPGVRRARAHQQPPDMTRQNRPKAWGHSLVRPDLMFWFRFAKVLGGWSQRIDRICFGFPDSVNLSSSKRRSFCFGVLWAAEVALQKGCSTKGAPDESQPGDTWCKRCLNATGFLARFWNLAFLEMVENKLSL